MFIGARSCFAVLKVPVYWMPVWKNALHYKKSYLIIIYKLKLIYYILLILA